MTRCFTRIAQPRQRGWLVIIIAAVALTAAARPSPSQTVFHKPVQKISEEILAHRAAKQMRSGESIQAYRQRLGEAGVSAVPDAEDCALYVEKRLTDAEIAELKADGIEVYPNLYIPPVAGRHPYGYHLARVPYDRLGRIETDARIIMLNTAELQHKPMNNTGGALIHTDDVHAGNGVTARTGAGVMVAIADSGLDMTHADVPAPVEAYDVTDGIGQPNWGTDVSNTVTAHGTHVTGSVLGRGTLSSGRANEGNGAGAFKGSASGASLCFYKIGDDVFASSTEADEIEALDRAATVGCRVFSMSYGGIDTYMDGSSAMCQAIDNHTLNSTMTIFISAGNMADDAKHDSVSVAPGATSPAFGLTINNTGASPYVTEQWIRVIWRDGAPGDANLTLTCTNLGGGETLTQAFSGASVRSTDAKRYVLTPNVPAASSKTYTLTLTNTAVSGMTPVVHCYVVSGIGTFSSPDMNYTVINPALADTAIAVGAWVHRSSWTNYQGSGYSYGETQGGISSFSSRGPRIDGVLKPDICAPGSAVISLRDSVVSASNALIVDNDGLGVNGSGPANYLVMQGTSMACPMAAGAAALLIEAYPNLTPQNIRDSFTSNASQSGAPDATRGYGLINALAAIQNYVPVTVSRFAVE